MEMNLESHTMSCEEGALGAVRAYSGGSGGVLGDGRKLPEAETPVQALRDEQGLSVTRAAHAKAQRLVGSQCHEERMGGWRSGHKPGHVWPQIPH